MNTRKAKPEITAEMLRELHAEAEATHGLPFMRVAIEMQDLLPALAAVVEERDRLLLDASTHNQTLRSLEHQFGDENARLKSQVAAINEEYGEGEDFRSYVEMVRELVDAKKQVAALTKVKEAADKFPWAKDYKPLHEDNQAWDALAALRQALDALQEGEKP